MTDQALARNGNGAAQTIEHVLVGGDLARLSVEQRLSYYRAVCTSLGLNELTRPFEYLTLNNRLILYARKDATDQLRALRRVGLQIVSRERIDDLYVVTARATLPDGRTDEEIGAVSVAGLKGEALANAMMKAVTKSKRRVTLSACGLGLLDETEVETIPEARRFEERAPTVVEEPPAGTKVSNHGEQFAADFADVFEDDPTPATPDVEPSKLWPQVQAMQGRLTDADLPYTLPAPDQDATFHAEWLTRMQGALDKQRRGQNAARSGR